MTDLFVGSIKWFGGLNSKTGRVNEFGFIDASGKDVFVHRSQVISPVQALAPDVSVIFRLAPGRPDRPAAEQVRVLSEIPDEEAGQILEELRTSPADGLRVLLSRKVPSEWRDQIIATIPRVEEEHHSTLLREFWATFKPSSLDDPLYSLAPWYVRLRTIRDYYGPARDLVCQIFDSTARTVTGINAATLYASIGDRDKEIARQWAGDGRPAAVYAKMLSARAAELAAKEIYEGAGHAVRDVSITQLEVGRADWLTHDLLLDRASPIDVKNSRRPIGSKNFYVEHTVPKFKLDRRRSDVRISAFLSPYITAGLIDKPLDRYFPKEEVVFLGETSASDMDGLSKAFDTPTFSVPRTTDRVFPSWVFTYPASWYGDLGRFVEAARGMNWPTEADWDTVFSDLNNDVLIRACCVLQKALPTSITEEMASWQILLYDRLRSAVEPLPNLPAIFLTILTDFLLALREDREGYAPNDYEQFLFVGSGVRFPLGAIDPLQLVSNLIKTLEKLWVGRGETRLGRFRQFRFVGLGILQGRESPDRPWATIIAYCGGVEYEIERDGQIRFDGGNPVPRGKCGYTPLIIGESQTCASCRKLICASCSFCSQPCRDRSLREASLKAAERVIQRERSQNEERPIRPEAPAWDVPLDAYENEGRWERIR